MSAKSIETQLERMARELIAVAKALDCAVHLDVTKYSDGTFGGSIFKIGITAISYDFKEDKKVDFHGLATDNRHLMERQDEV